MKLLKLSIILLVLAVSTQAIDLKGLFKSAFWAGASQFTCFAQNLTEVPANTTDETQEELNIDPVELPANKTEGDIEGLFIKDLKMPKFPKRLYKKFKKLRAIECENTGLEALTDEDFRDLTFLVYVSFPKNKLKMLPGRLFRFTPNLKWVKFHGNSELVNIGFNLFKSLKFIIELNFGGSACTNETVTDSTDLSKTAVSLFSACPPDPEDFKEDMNNMECTYVEKESSKESSKETS